MAGGSSGWRARACGEEDCERNGLSSLTSGGEQIARWIASQGEWQVYWEGICRSFFYFY
jgi:hypothetical protein